MKFNTEMEISSSYSIQDKQTKDNFFLLPIITKTYACTVKSLDAMLMWKSCARIYSVQEFLEKEAWLLLTLFICLHNHFSSMYSILTY